MQRCVLNQVTKLVGYTLAQHGDLDGSNIRVGVPRLAAICGMGARTAQRHVAALRDVGLIERLSNGGGRGRTERAAEYRLTVPLDLEQRVQMLPSGTETAATSERREFESERETGATQERREFPAGEETDANPEWHEFIPEPKLAPPEPKLAPFEAETRANHPPMTSGDAAKPQRPNHHHQADRLAVVVVEALPAQLREQMTLAKVAQSCTRLISVGWTPDELSRATTARSWAGAQSGGAVISWLNGLGAPPRRHRGRAQANGHRCPNGRPIAADGTCCGEEHLISTEEASDDYVPA